MGSNVNNRAKIVIFSCFYEPYTSGAERFVKEVTERLAGRFDFFILTARLDKKNPKQEIKTIRGSSYEIRRIGFGTKLDKWIYIILAPFYVMKFNPRIVHAVMESYAGVALMLYKWVDGDGKTILTLQSGDLDSGKKQWKIPGFLWKGIHRTPDFITAISTFLRDRALRLGAKRSAVSVIPNGVDLKTIPAKNETIPHRVVCVARISWEKGIQYLVEAWPAVLREYPDATLVLVGPEDNREVNIMKSITDFISRNNLTESIKFKGALPHDETLKEISYSEVFVCPSLAEGLGIVFIEAQAVGVPVIGTAVGGIPDVIQNEETGLLIRPRDPDAISRAIIKMFKDKNFSQSLAKKAKEKINRFDWNVIADQVSDLYSSLI